MAKFIKCKHEDGTLFIRWITSGKLVDEEQKIRIQDTVKDMDETLVSVVPMEDDKVTWIDPDGLKHNAYIFKGNAICVDKKFIFDDGVKDGLVAATLKEDGWIILANNSKEVTAEKEGKNTCVNVSLPEDDLDACIEALEIKINALTRNARRILMDEGISLFELLSGMPRTYSKDSEAYRLLEGLYKKLIDIREKRRKDKISQILMEAGVPEEKTDEVISKLLSEGIEKLVGRDVQP